MKKNRILILVAVMSAVAPFGAAADDPAQSDYTQGIIYVNEDWYGHQNSTINYLMPDDPDGVYWSYRIIQAENPGMELGCTNQHGALWKGRFYMIAKQERDPGASVTGGRISVADARTMKMVKQLQVIDPSGNQCDGRAFCGVDEKKGYVSTSNGIWILNLETLEIEGQVEGSANPNAGGDNDKPNDDPTGALYHGQTGMMVRAAGKIFAVHQQYGMLVIDPATDKVVEVLDMTIVDDAVEADTGTRPRRTSGIGSTIVRSKDGNLWYSASKNVQGTGSALPYIIRLDPVTLEREIVRISKDDGVFPPPNSWYAWTPDAWCASRVNNVMYWCGGNNSWFTNQRIFRFDIDSRTVTKIRDFTQEEGSWSVYGCSLGIHPLTDELYASMFHKFVDPTYEVWRFDADGKTLQTYPMIQNYWFPSLPVFPQAPEYEESGTESVQTHTATQLWWDGNSLHVTYSDSDVVEIYDMAGSLMASHQLLSGEGDFQLALPPGIYIARSGSKTLKFVK